MFKDIYDYWTYLFFCRGVGKKKHGGKQVNQSQREVQLAPEVCLTDSHYP